MMYVCKLLPSGRERGQQVWSDCLVRIYWRVHVEDWCVVTWRDCTWWVGVFVSTPPPHPTTRLCTCSCHSFHLGYGEASDTWAMVACSVTWHGTWWQGVFCWPPLPPTGSCTHVTICPHGMALLGVGGGYWWLGVERPYTTFTAISKLNFKHTYLKLFLGTASSDLRLCTQLAMSFSL
jgi:hypothetical protein